jgi:RHH-type proline utilization regulon transcriptional repressor/proline dehydrogenase/delta 1-pyrroline-5-carboxylate dehydrogenase
MTGVPDNGRFVAPTAIRLDRFEQMKEEIFGPVLHVLEFDAHHIGAVVDTVNASGFGLTFGLHSRIDDRVEAICARVHAGNVYVNRNQIGAVVGVQPFGGEGLSGTGPKAGGPHYLPRFTRPAERRAWWGGTCAPVDGQSAAESIADPQLFADSLPRAQGAWDARRDRAALLQVAASRLPSTLQKAAASALRESAHLLRAVDALPGPTGESNHLTHHGRGIALCLGEGADALTAQCFAALAAGDAVALAACSEADVIIAALVGVGLDRTLAVSVDATDMEALVASFPDLGVTAFDGDAQTARSLRLALAARHGRRVLLVSLEDGVELLATERVVSIDTTASGGNATLLTLSEGESA